MRFNKYIAAVLAAGVLAGTSTSCTDSFLEETQRTALNTDYFKTQEGLDELVIGSYDKLRFKFNYIWGYNCYNMGVDEFTGGNNDISAWNHYSTDLNSSETPNNPSLQPMWDNMFGLVEPANILLENIPQYYSESSADYNTRLGEAYFFRAYGYFELVKQFGGVPLKLHPSTGVETYFTRNSEEECYAQIIDDFYQAYTLLPSTGEALGRVTKSAAAHFLAKAHLFRASEAYDSWNSSYKDEDLDAVITYGKEVIAAHPLCDDFVELWDYTGPNSANESVSEVVLSAQFSDNWATAGRYGNQMHLCFPSVYQNLSGTKRDISGGREFSYVSATEYSMQVFDRVNDSRFWKSFITTYGCNDTSSAPTWDDTDIRDGKAPDGAVSGDKRFVGGELGMKYIVNNPGDTRYSGGSDELHVTNNLTGKYENTHTWVRYFKEDGNQLNWNTDVNNTTGNYYKIVPHNRSVALSKHRDGSRQTIASQFGARDAIIARSAEDVLMVAEAYIRKGDYTSALTYLNMVRDRAGYASGEDRSKHVDGGQAYKTNTACTSIGSASGGYSDEGAIYWETNTYYESNNIAETTESTKSNMHLNSVSDIINSEADMPIYTKLGCTTDAEKMMCFLLNERTRELIGESHRWEDLARTRTLDARWHAFNDGSTRGIGDFDPDKHYYRPIPQSFLDGITNEDGSELTNEQKQAMQNPGY